MTADQERINVPPMPTPRHPFRVGDRVAVREADRADWRESCETYGYPVPQSWTGTITLAGLVAVGVEIDGYVYDAVDPDALERAS